ncbi:hypothetical protein PV05_04031 [Exophiala xenobiotica]|uniref:Zn(2)-C6 fungal-type domain-containing protein n=1 Tax=Exophiala xenobiotica TaxID=348802 RepID=A0A0D2FHH0_9EURO|nr:uncharacterized protein PV05_04031 [Exophiala xenobiotica]KIW59589.1 hypothetical protein PV05_04031 [Exophiala xenobiotica]
MDPSSSPHSQNSSSKSSSPVITPIRTGSACQSCKKRKTKCTGQPGPCANCSKTGTYCHFDMKLDGRRKHSYEATDIHYRQQFILDALLRSIKYNDADLVQRLVEAIRLGRPLLEIATALQDNIRALQGKMLSKENHVTLSDMISLALNCLSDSDFRPHGNSRTSLPLHQTFVLGDSFRVTKNKVVLDGARTSAMRDISMDQMSRRSRRRSQASGAQESCPRQRYPDGTKATCDTWATGGSGSPSTTAASCVHMPSNLLEDWQVPKSPQAKHKWSVADDYTSYAPQHQHQDQVHAPTDPGFASDKGPTHGCQPPLGYLPEYFVPPTYINEQFTTCSDHCDAASQMMREIPRPRCVLGAQTGEDISWQWWPSSQPGWPLAAWSSLA